MGNFAGLAVKTGKTTPGVVSRDVVSFSTVPFSVSPVPLPAGLPMFGGALLGLIGFGVRSRRARRFLTA